MTNNEKSYNPIDTEGDIYKNYKPESQEQDHSNFTDLPEFGLPK